MTPGQIVSLTRQTRNMTTFSLSADECSRMIEEREERALRYAAERAILWFRSRYPRQPQAEKDLSEIIAGSMLYSESGRRKTA